MENEYEDVIGDPPFDFGMENPLKNPAYIAWTQEFHRLYDSDTIILKKGLALFAEHYTDLFD
jgi:hypothetical protein